jgi:hypothetical protein
MLFKDWRLLDQSPVDLNLNRDYVYCIHSRAWALKGWLGGTHSWTTFWSEEHQQWLVIELSDKETINVQQASLYWIREDVEYQEHSPIISNRCPTAKWFGTIPIILGKHRNTFTYSDFVNVCKSYPIKKFKLLNQNCNTFTSFLIARLNLDIKRPVRSIGSRNKRYWNELYK